MECKNQDFDTDYALNEFTSKSNEELDKWHDNLHKAYASEDAVASQSIVVDTHSVLVNEIAHREMKHEEIDELDASTYEISRVEKVVDDETREHVFEKQMETLTCSSCGYTIEREASDEQLECPKCGEKMVSADKNEGEPNTTTNASEMHLVIDAIRENLIKLEAMIEIQ